MKKQDGRARVAESNQAGKIPVHGLIAPPRFAAHRRDGVAVGNKGSAQKPPRALAMRSPPRRNVPRARQASP